MKQLVFLFALIFIFSCESEPLEGFDEAADEAALVFPDAECGEVVIESDGVILNLLDDGQASVDTCQLNLYASKYNPDGSIVTLLIRITNPELTTYNLADYTGEDPCDAVRVFIGFSDGVDPDSSYGYSTYSTWGGTGELTLTSYVYDTSDSDPTGNHMTGYFHAVGGLVGEDPPTDVGFFEFTGTFNKYPIDFVCNSPFC